MTKHVSPKNVGTEFIGTDYIRPDDDAIMVEVSPGCFVNRDYQCSQTNVGTPIEDEEIPWHAKARKRLTDFETFLYSLIQELPRTEVVEISRVRKKPRCNLALSQAPWRNITIFRKQDDRLFCEMATRAVGFRHSTPRALARILSGRLDSYGPRENTEDARRNKVKIAKYNVDFPESENPEHTLFPRDPRNASPTRTKDAERLNAFWDYRVLNQSTEHLQSNWGSADNDNYHEAKREEGDPKIPERDAEAELETRPTENELADCYDVPTVQYETRMVSTVDYPRVIEPGYCVTCGMTEMKIPIGGDVWCVGFSKETLLEYDASARSTLPRRGVRRTQKQIDDYIDRIAKPELLNISDVAKHRKWSLLQMGGLFFTPYQTKRHYRGQLTHYTDSKGQKRVAKEDEYGTPYGPESKGSDERNWKPSNPRASQRTIALLSPAERAKQLANKANPIPCLPLTTDALEAFRLKLLANGKPTNDNQQHDGLPYDIKSKDELQVGFAFGARYEDAPDSDPEDDIVERRETLGELNSKLSPEARLVANMVVQSDETDKLAQSYADVGAAIFTGRTLRSERTLMRHGQQAVNDTAKEIGTILQELAA